jgi:hypothetical protein
MLFLFLVFLAECERLSSLTFLEAHLVYVRSIVVMIVDGPAIEEASVWAQTPTDLPAS